MADFGNIYLNQLMFQIIDGSTSIFTLKHTVNNSDQSQEYLNILKKVFLVAKAPHFRSKARSDNWPNFISHNVMQFLFI